MSHLAPKFRVQFSGIKYFFYDLYLKIISISYTKCLSRGETYGLLVFICINLDELIFCRKINDILRIF